jgi:hypothetical protein
MHANWHASFLYFIEQPAAFSNQVFELVKLQGMPTVSAVFYRFLLANIVAGIYLGGSKKGFAVTKRQSRELEKTKKMIRQKTF